MSLFGWDKGTAGDKTQRGVVAVSYLLILGMFVCSVVLARSVPDESDVSGAGVGLAAFLLFSAAAALGAGLGFLFGLPRSRYADLEAASQATSRPGTGSTDTAIPRSAHYLTNSNLIKVSDWLTTIIIGVGLVNLAKIGPAVGNLADTLEEPLGGAPYAGIVGVSVIIIALLASIILCYLWTSIRVRELLEESEGVTQRDVPPLVGLTVGEAKTVLGETSLKVTPDADDDDIIESQRPSAGSTVIGSDVSADVSTSHTSVDTPSTEV